jgi:uncharacterized RDD family membrane protein YckC/RNA polymerase subunit RPABC4/transcription elongation factor Spt4
MATTFFSCGQCGQPAGADARFCPSCGTEVVRSAPRPDAAARVGAAPPPPFSATRLCGQCGTEFATAARFCPGCAAPAGVAPSASGTASGTASGAAPGTAQGPVGYGAAPQFTAASPAQPAAAPFTCARCGEQISSGTRFCPRCGNTTAAIGPVANSEAYGGFWVRFAADLIDGVIMAVVAVLFLWIPIADIVITFVLVCLYGAMMESSPRQATLGKQAMGLKVTDLEGRRLTFNKALGRGLLKLLFKCFLLTWLTFLAIAFTVKRQGVHDVMAGTLVWKAR